jgi:NAD(P)-dependent dehydrogenase (short-subunit alcohol dehydrogenase family)
MAKALGAAGARVAVLDLNGESADKVAHEIERAGGTGVGVQCDVLKKEALLQAHQEVLTKLGPTDILINGAGGNKKEATTSPDLSFFDLPIEAVRFVFDLNFLSAFVTTQVFARDMIDRGAGVVLNIASMNALRPLTRIPAYSAAKASITNFTQWLAVHLCQNCSPHIRVNALAPGFFLTEQNRFLLTQEGTGELTERGKRITEHTPMGRFGNVEDLIGPTLWLVSDDARFVNGVVLPVDGGFSAYSGV